MLISMFLHLLLMLHRCYSHRHACTPSSLLQPDRSHTQPEYEYATILVVVVIMGGEESRPRSFFEFGICFVYLHSLSDSIILKILHFPLSKS